MKRILCVGAAIDMHLGIFDDLIGQSKDVDVCYIQPRYKKGLLGFLYRVLLSERVNSIIHIANKNYLYNISKYDFKHYDVILFVNGALSYPYISSVLNACKASGVKTILYVLDSLSSGSPIVKKTIHLIESKLWDEVFTFDINDAKVHNFKFVGLHYYSRFKDICASDNLKYDMYFTGGLKGGREQLIEDLFKKGRSNHVDMLFDIMTYGRDDINIVDGIKYRNKWISYHSVVESVCDSNCILDIRQENQVGPSFRYYEAVCYNKKLLTNNPNIRELPYFNSMWMKIFDSIEDIDWNWVKQREKINYNYKGDFSPLRLIEYLNIN